MFEDSIVCCVKENPEPVTFRICCQGVRPEVELDRRQLHFEKLLLHRLGFRRIAYFSHLFADHPSLCVSSLHLDGNGTWWSVEAEKYFREFLTSLLPLDIIMLLKSKSKLFD